MALDTQRQERQRERKRGEGEREGWGGCERGEGRSKKAERERERDTRGARANKWAERMKRNRETVGKQTVKGGKMTATMKSECVVPAQVFDFSYHSQGAGTCGFWSLTSCPL